MLREIHQYYKTKVSVKVALKIKNSIFSAAIQLQYQPESGQIEPNLEKLKQGHRYVVRGNYKIIYKAVAEGILITDVFDTRQDPIKQNDDKR